MLRKILRDFLILFGLAALILSTSQTFMQYVWRERDGTKWWDTNPLKGGNLAALADLTFLKKFYSPEGPLKHATYTGRSNTALYLDGDSYTWSLRDTNFSGIADYHFISRYNGGAYHLDTAKRNILIIEITEIWIRRYFRSLNMYNEVRDPSLAKEAGTSIHHLPDSGMPLSATFVPAVSIHDLFNKNINQNLQCNLFNYNFMMRMFQLKGALNYYLFKRASGDVVISGDGNFLFLKTSVSWTDTGSSYVPLLPGETDNLVSNLNLIYSHYKAEGFKEVYLSMIPSTTSLVQPDGYNNLIPLIQNDPRLRIKLIDVYDAFKQSPELYFFHGDSHWNTRGKQTWVNMVNGLLTTYK